MDVSRDLEGTVVDVSGDPLCLKASLTVRGVNVPVS